MRTVTTTTTTNIYKFDELSEGAKGMAIAEQREWEAGICLDDLIDCMRSAMDKMGITIKNYSISADGSGYINLSTENDDLEGIRAYKYITNNFFSDADKNKVYYLKDWSKHRESNLDDKYWMDMCYDSAIKEAWQSWCDKLKEGNNPSVRDFLDELEWAYLKEQSRGYYGFGEEQARDLAEVNGYEYLEDGTIY